MKGIKVLLGLSITAVGLTAVGAGVFATQSNNSFAKVNAADFSNMTITRRIWFVNNDNWWTADKLYVHAYGGSLAADAWSGEASKIYDAYYYGLYYADITAKGIGSAITVQIKNGSGDTDQFYTVGVSLPALSSKEVDVVWLNSGLTDNHRNANKKEAGGTSGFVATILEHELTCDASYAYGYNAYPQLLANFITPSSGEITQYGEQTMVDDFSYEDYVANGKVYDDNINRTEDLINLNQKIAGLRSMYEEYGWK